MRRSIVPKGVLPRRIPLKPPALEAALGVAAERALGNAIMGFDRYAGHGLAGKAMAIHRRSCEEQEFTSCRFEIVAATFRLDPEDGRRREVPDRACADRDQRLREAARDVRHHLGTGDKAYLERFGQPQSSASATAAPGPAGERP